MLNQILSILFLTITGVVQELALEQMLRVKEHTTRRMRVTYWVMLYFILSIIYVGVNNRVYTQYIRNAIYWAGIMISAAIFYCGPIWRRVIANVVLTFAMSASELAFAIGRDKHDMRDVIAEKIK